MEVTVRKVLDYDTNINLNRLGVVGKLKTSIVLWYRDSSSYRNKVEKENEKILTAQIAEDDKLKQDLLTQIYSRLVLNTALKQYNETTNSIFILVKSSYQESILRVLGIDSNGAQVGSVDSSFASYDIERVPENRDIRLARPDLDIMLKITQVTLGGAV